MRISLLIIVFTFFLTSCEKETKSQGNGGFLFGVLKIGFTNWESTDVKRFSGSKGISFDAFAHSGSLKSASLVMTDTITKEVLFKKSSNTITNSLFRFQDTIYLFNFTDTITAKLTIEGTNEKETASIFRLLKIGK